MQSDIRLHSAPFRLETRAANEQLWQDATGYRAEAQRCSRCSDTSSSIAGQLVTKQQLLDAVVAGNVRHRCVLKDSIKQLRDALGDEAATPRFIETAHPTRLSLHRPHLGATDATVVPAALAITPEHRRGAADNRGSDAMRDRRTERVRGSGRSKENASSSSSPANRDWTNHADESDGAMKRSRDASAWHTGKCLEHYGAGEAFLPVLECLSRLGRAPDGDRVIEQLRRHAPTWLLELPSCLPDSEREMLRQRAGGVTRERMLRELADGIEAIAAESPLMIVLEDLHWSDFSTLDAISYRPASGSRAPDRPGAPIVRWT
jgi:hypothetical protein